MSESFPPISPRLPHMLHGADYNPEQWPEEVWNDDVRLMQLAGCNVMSVGIFSWSMLEPKRGKYEFAWLDRVLDNLDKHGVKAILATPSGAKPTWMGTKYPEIRRVTAERERELQGRRHNHCPTSPTYRRFVHAIDSKLAERYQAHPAVIAWHVSNEFGGECHCELCQTAFRGWLRERYDDDLDKLNHSWWTTFWSHRYSDWGQIESPSPRGERHVHGLNLDWKRFVTHQTIDFYKQEAAAIRRFDQSNPITTNFMGSYPGLDYVAFAKEVDVVSWDSYPTWHAKGETDWAQAASVAFHHDLNRSLKGGKPFLLMESTPSNTNWQQVCKLKRPGMHLLSSLQAVAHGSDSVQYFQWRKSRGSCEKFHGAVVDHAGHEHTRVFRDVQDVGQALARLDDVVGSRVDAQVAVVFDWENRWAIDDLAGWSQHNRNYVQTCVKHYRQFWRRGISVDVVDQTSELQAYKLVVAPMLYLLRPGMADRLRDYVKGGGTLVMTYGSAEVDQHDLCFLGGWPGGGLREVFGIWVEELDALHPGEKRSVVCCDDNQLGLSGQFDVVDYWESVHLEGARALAEYGEDMFKGQPALTVNHFGEGSAYYMAARNTDAFLGHFYGQLCDHLLLPRAVPCVLPKGLTAQRRVAGDTEFIFLLNFSASEEQIDLRDAAYTNLVSGETVTGMVRLASFGSRVLARSISS